MTDQSSSDSLDVQSLSVSMTVKDVEKSAAWYHDALGFSIDQRRERDGKVHAIALRAGTVRMLLNQDDGAKGVDRVKGQGVSLYFTVQQDIDALAARATASGVALQSGPADMPWGVRMFTLYDLDGFKLVFARLIGS